MANVVSVQMEWAYSPEDYFDRIITIPFNGGNISMNKGKVLAEIDPSIYEKNRSLPDYLDKIVENKFHLVQQKANRSYELGLPCKRIIRSDGSRIVSAK